jgi:hypothetical protein
VNEKADDADKRLSIWPKTPAKLGLLLRRDHNVYISQGIKIKYVRDIHGRRWELSTKKEFREIKNSVPNFNELPVLNLL